MCQVVTRLKIEEAIATGARTVEDVGACCSAGTDCGKCRNAIMRLLASANAAEAAARPGVPIRDASRNRAERHAHAG